MNYERYVGWVTGIGLGMGLLVVLNQLQIPYYLFYPRTTQAVLISSSYDFYLFLVSSISVPLTFTQHRTRLPIPAAIGTVGVWAVSAVLALVNEPFSGTIVYATVVASATLRVFYSGARRRALREILPSAVALLLLVEWASICYWVSAAISPRGHFGIVSQQLEADVTFFLYPVAIPMLLLLLFSWLWIPLVGYLSRPKTHYKIRYTPSAQKPDVRIIVAALDLFAIISLIVFFYPYLAGQTWVVGQDTFWRYIDPLNGLVGLAPSDAFNTSATHGVYVVLLYLLQSSTGVSVAMIVKYAPLALAFATASAALFATLRGGWNFRPAILASLCTLLWLPTTVGIYVAIQANWLALCLWFVFLAVYFRAYDGSRKSPYIVLALLSLVILLVHPWTWGVFGTTLLFTAVLSRKTVWSQHALRTLAAAMALAIPFGTAAYSLSPSLNYDLTNTIRLYVSGPINPASLLTFGQALANTFYNLGPALSPALLLLCLVGGYAVAKRRDITANYLIAWSAAWCIGSILAAPSGLNPTNPGLSETGLWRMLYISPLPFLLALGIEKFLRTSKRPSTASSRKGVLPGFVSIVSTLPFVAISVVLFFVGDVNLRLMLVVVALVAALVLVLRLEDYPSLDILIVSVLVLILFNAAFRTLYPLVLDPHNIFAH
jgi:hypothetical protein